MGAVDSSDKPVTSKADVPVGRRIRRTMPTDARQRPVKERFGGRNQVSPLIQFWLLHVMSTQQRLFVYSASAEGGGVI